MPIAISHVSHRYGSDAIVLDRVSLLVHSGKSLALVGPSGSGKTTLLGIMGLLLRPSVGRVEFDGIEVGTNAARRREAFGRCAWVFQTSNLLPRRTSLENTMLGPMSTGVSAAVAAITARRALGALAMEPFIGSAVRLLSGGQAQRVGIARALATNPDFLFADEPTGQLDAESSQLVMSAFLEGRSVDQITVIATHDMNVAAACDEIIRVRRTRLDRLQ